MRYVKGTERERERDALIKEGEKGAMGRWRGIGQKKKYRGEDEML